MSFARYMRALRRSWWLVAALLLLGIAGGLLKYETATRIYASSVKFYISTPSQSAAINSQYADNQFAQARANTYAFLMSSETTAQKVRNAAGLKESVPKIAASISGTAELNTVLVSATVLDSDPHRAHHIAQALAQVFPQIVSRLDNAGLPKPSVVLHVVSGPTIPVRVSPRLIVDLGLGVVIGLFLGLVLAVLRELRDLAVRSSAALQEVRDLPLLGAIPLDGKADEAPLIIGSWTQTPRAEALRQLRTNLQFVDVDAPPRVIVVTSSVPSEGKSLTAVNLAIAYGEVEEKVLLVECDLRRPRVTEYLGLPRAAGLSNVLAGQAEVADVVQEWGSLSVLPSGPTPPNVAAMLSSERMSEFVQWARTQYDVVVIDTPPLLPVTDAAVASTLADGAVVVTGHAKVTRHQLSNALNALEAVHANVLGFVYNMIPRREAHEYGGNYSAYGYADPTPAVPDLGVEKANGASHSRASRRAAKKASGLTRAGRG